MNHFIEINKKTYHFFARRFGKAHLMGNEGKTLCGMLMISFNHYKGRPELHNQKSICKECKDKARNV